MKYPTRLSDAVHILAFIALYPDCDLTSNKLAESIQTNPAYVRHAPCPPCGREGCWSA